MAAPAESRPSRLSRGLTPRVGIWRARSTTGATGPHTPTLSQRLLDNVYWDMDEIWFSERQAVVGTTAHVYLSTPGPRNAIRDLDVLCRITELRAGYAYCDLFVYDAAGLYEFVPLVDGPIRRTHIRRMFPIYERGHAQVTSELSEATPSADPAIRFQ